MGALFGQQANTAEVAINYMTKNVVNMKIMSRFLVD